mgnify:CR=1 FL=1
MKILVANLGSTSFKYRLFDMQGERQLARGGIERIGSPESRAFAEIGEHRRRPGEIDHERRVVQRGNAGNWSTGDNHECASSSRHLAANRQMV